MVRGKLTAGGDAQRIGWIAGTTHTVLLDGRSTQDRLTVLRSVFGQGSASPSHVHDREDETIVVLSGSAVVWVGEDRWAVGPGDTVFMPRGLPHTYLVTAPATELLTVCTPAGIEGFFQAAGWDLADPRPGGWEVDVSRLAEHGAGFGQRVLGPPVTDPDGWMRIARD